MTAFKDQPLSRKTLILGVVPTICAIALVGVASMIATYFSARSNLVVDLEAQATILAENVSAALAFGDQDTATSTLRAIRTRPNIETACLFDARDNLFASFTQPGYTCGETLTTGVSERRSIVLDAPVLLGSRRVGTLRISGNLTLLYAWMRRQAYVMLGALVGSLLVAVALTQRIRRAVSSPVLALASTADAISASRDYSLRATQVTADEVGGLVQSFNAMLDEIQRRNEALMVEIVERKRAEHLKDEFLAAVSHELRTPLNAVLGWLQILRQTTPSPERIARALEILERNARSQARVIEDLLDISRIVSGKLQIRVGVVDLCAVVTAAMDVISTAAAAKKVHTSITVPDGPCLVSGDAERLQQVVLNVLANAVKFTSASGEISVSLTTEAAGREFCLSIADTGIGIAPDFLSSVWERFRQADGSMTRQHGGLGLGLAIVKEVTELHGGRVSAWSAGLGHGATFTIRLPQLVLSDSTTPERLAPPAAANGLRGIRVLLVDDEPDGLEVAATALQEAGASVTAVSSGAEAIASWQRARHDVLVCDLAMPGIDGFEVLARVREWDRLANQVPVAVALTAYASPEYQARSLEAGFQVHIAKPYNTADMIHGVIMALASMSREKDATNGPNTGESVDVC